MQPEVERELIRKCKAGDARFYEPLVRAYESSGMRLAVADVHRPVGHRGARVFDGAQGGADLARRQDATTTSARQGTSEIISS